MPPYFFCLSIIFPLMAVGVGMGLSNREFPYFPITIAPLTPKIGICPEKIGNLRLFFLHKNFPILQGLYRYGVISSGKIKAK